MNMIGMAQEALARFSTWLFTKSSSSGETAIILGILTALVLFSIYAYFLNRTIERVATRLADESIDRYIASRQVREEVARMIEHGTIRCSTSEDLATAIRRGAKCHPECSECAGMKKPS